MKEYHICLFHRIHRPLKHHQNQFPMSIFDKVMAKNRFSRSTLAAILNFVHNKKCSRVTKLHQAVLGSVGSVLPESAKKRCMYSETHLGHKFAFCHQTSRKNLHLSVSGKLQCKITNHRLSLFQLIRAKVR